MNMNMNIDEIQALTEEQAREMAERHEVIKEHDIYFAYLGDYFKYGCLVFKDGRQIYYANDYELHHPGKTKAELDEWYRETLQNKLFTDDEFDSVEDYYDYRSKAYFLTNYYSMRVPYVSGFRIIQTKEQEKAFEDEVKGLVRDPIGFCYVESKEFVEKHIQLWNTLTKNYDKLLEDYDKLKSMFRYEMGNHEYHINYQGNWDVLTCCFGNTEFDCCDNYEVYFEQLGLTDVQRKAYVDARREYLATCEY